MPPHATYGCRAVQHGTPDLGLNGDGIDGVETDATDTITNIMHYVADVGGDPDAVASQAITHYYAELAEQERKGWIV